MTQNQLIQLSDEQQREFYQNGYTLVKQVFTAEEMDLIDAGFNNLKRIAHSLTHSGLDKRVAINHGGSRFTLENNGESHVVRHIAWAGAQDENLNRLGSDPRLVHLACQLLGSDSVQQLIHQAHYKDPGGNVAFGWHQDSEHRGMSRGEFVDLNGNGSYVQIACAVDDVTMENGPVQMIHGTGQLGHQPHTDLVVDAKWIDHEKIVTPCAKRGDCLLFGPYTIHGSQPNRSTKSRRVFINGFAQPGAWKSQPHPDMNKVGRTLKKPKEN